MSQNPFQVILQAYETLTQCIQSRITYLMGDHHNSSPRNKRPLFLLSSSPKLSSSSPSSKAEVSKADPALFQSKEGFSKVQLARPLTKEELGRATWTLLHTIAAQFPENPTKQQKRDVKELMAILSRIYPCKECADHFKEVLRANPIQVGSHTQFSQWLCHVHNVVNRSLGKLVFPCQRVDARWGKLECEGRACDLEGTTTSSGEGRI